MYHERNPDCPHWQMEDLIQANLAARYHLENRLVGVPNHDPINGHGFAKEMAALEKKLNEIKRDPRYKIWADWGKPSK